MTPIPEVEFHHYVGDWLREYFAPACIDHEPSLPTTGRRPDYRVTTPWDCYLIEVENRFDDLYTGVGQAEFYAAHDPAATPVVIIPAGQYPEPELSYFERIVHTEQLDILEWAGGGDA